MNKVLTLSMRLLGSFGLDETKRSMNGLWPMRRRRISRSMELSVWDAALDDVFAVSNGQPPRKSLRNVETRESPYFSMLPFQEKEVCISWARFKTNKYHRQKRRYLPSSMHDTNNFLLLSIESMSLASAGRPSSSSLIKIFLFLYFI